MAMAERPDSVSLLGQITCPTQIIVGELDLPTPPSDAQVMADRIPGARVTIIPGAAHLSNLERSDQFNETIRSFALDVTHAASR